MARELAELAASRPSKPNPRPAWVEIPVPTNPDPKAISALHPSAAGGNLPHRGSGAHPVDLAQLAGAALRAAAGRKGRSLSAGRRWAEEGEADGSGVDIDAVSLRHMPNSTGRALLAEGRGARVKITRCGWMMMTDAR